ncbi:MAG: hypothetical protein Ct9H300mP9_6030 [Candidatus Neomarinimicrobiota bacterium]|nr:MAG: hypothetical protein Ct9H300mP9_6030 [Candidatus Neomarinimicrobiota bacterium]
MRGTHPILINYIFLDGVDDHANVGNLFTKIPKDLTIEAWIKTASSNQGILIFHDEDAIGEKKENRYFILIMMADLRSLVMGKLSCW